MTYYLNIAKILSLIILVIGISTSCEPHDSGTSMSTSAAAQAHPEIERQIAQILDDIYISAQQKDFDRLGAFHLYTPKFTEFKSGQRRQGASENKQDEIAGFDAIEDFKYDLRDLEVAVYGATAISTFHGHFAGEMGGQSMEMDLQSTLVFVQVDGDWKIVHEHFSPLIAE